MESASFFPKPQQNVFNVQHANVKLLLTKSTHSLEKVNRLICYFLLLQNIIEVVIINYTIMMERINIYTEYEYEYEKYKVYNQH